MHVVDINLLLEWNSRATLLPFPLLVPLRSTQPFTYIIIMFAVSANAEIFSQPLQHLPEADMSLCEKS